MRTAYFDISDLLYAEVCMLADLFYAHFGLASAIQRRGERVEMLFER